MKLFGGKRQLPAFGVSVLLLGLCQKYPGRMRISPDTAPPQSQQSTKTAAQAGECLYFFMQSKPQLLKQKCAGLQLVFVKGGILHSCQADIPKNVIDFIHENNALGGINGTFYAVEKRKNSHPGYRCVPIGPWMTSRDSNWNAGNALIQGRPIVLWGEKQIAFLSFLPDKMNSPESMKEYIPDMTDMFVAGAWLVHQGKAVPFSRNGTRDAKDHRYRAFFGVSQLGEPIIGTSLDVTNSEMLSKALAQLGLQEAVLLDSGFSTCLVFQERQEGFGHTNRSRPTRKVPHAILVF